MLELHLSRSQQRTLAQVYPLFPLGIGSTVTVTPKAINAIFLATPSSKRQSEARLCVLMQYAASGGVLGGPSVSIN
jgi:hypothetical protein